MSFIKKIVVFVITLEAKLVLRKYQPKIAAVTGSVGKTSTKDIIHALFGKVFYASKSPKSFNSETGIPLTILECTKSGWRNPLEWVRVFWEGLILILLPSHYPKWLILEVGADRPGDIKKVSEWLPVDLIVLTKMSEVPVHVEFFDSPEAVLKEKLSLLGALKPGGSVVYNADDEMIKDEMDKREDLNKIPFGFGANAQVKASNYHAVYNRKKVPTGINFKINFNGSSLPVTLNGTLGRQQVYSVLAASACATAVGVNTLGALEGLNNYVPPPGRMRLLKGANNSLIIDDSYNSSPVALEEALETLKSIETPGRKITILGDMMELGKYSLDEHKKAGRLAAEFSDSLVTIGLRAKAFALGAREVGFLESKIMQFDNVNEVVGKLKNEITENDVILVKGSQSVRLEKLIEEIMAEPLKKRELLVRQEGGWKKIK